MKCDEIMAKFLSLDNGEKLTFRMRLHLMRCRNCKNEIKNLQLYFDKVRTCEPKFHDRDISQTVLEIIQNSRPLYLKKVSGTKWIAVELLFIAGIILLQFSTTKIWLDENLGSIFSIMISIALGVFITLYTGVIVIAHIDELNKVKRMILKLF